MAMALGVLAVIATAGMGATQAIFVDEGAATGRFSGEFVLAWDDFESSGFGGGDGWQEPWQATGSPHVDPASSYQGSYGVSLEEGDVASRSTVSESGAQDPRLQFYAASAISPSVGSGQGAVAEVSTDGASWSKVEEWTYTSGFQMYDIDLSGVYTSGQLHVRFRVEDTGGDNALHVDNIYIVDRVPYLTPTPSPSPTPSPTPEPNHSPDCSGASPSVGTIWPPNLQMVDISIQGVTDEDGDPVDVVITSIMQDEPVDADGNGDGHTSPDGAGIGTDTAQVRAERAGDGNGRVYHISFSADDGEGGTCEGTVTVGVPHDESGDPAVDDGPAYDSTQPADDGDEE